ncbi:hypothetical protein QQS21_009206 [Conoideocrella luteorostrata]|uniref:Major facilitator superfamily (MFS) profile domain-containing protein n=1 Tax=Conoideocrella luteorostrata TaxID=1105319 RepID=A0AAJ0CLQ6_9HYPO|nr:hypothetical protein QQS21_009206 [Conoideocrella luteorostrata]
MIYVLLTFTQLDIGFTAWGQYQDELGLSTNQLNNATALNYAGLAVGSFVFVPLMHKYGRRPLYLFSTVLQLASCIWLALAKTQADILLSSAMSGLGGAICETIVQVTISDLFFVHQHAAMNAYYLLFTGAGAFLGPVAAGYVVNSQGWRWIWWWCVILFGVNLLLVFFFFEESKHISVIRDQEVDRSDQTARVIHHKMNDTSSSVNRAEDEAAINYAQSPARPDDGIPLKSYRERMALTTCTGGSIFRTMHKPFPLLFTFPVIAFTALTYGSLLAVFAILTSVQAIYLFNAPYNFSAAGVGLMNIAPFIGTLPGVFIGGWLNDRSIIWLSRRNSGIYEPEMRLWFTLPFTVIAPAGVIMMGVGLSKVRNNVKSFICGLVVY